MSHVITTRLTDDEWEAYQRVMGHHNLSASQLLHSIVVDALVDEDHNGVRCRQSTGCESSREAGETCRPAET